MYLSLLEYLRSISEETIKVMLGQQDVGRFIYEIHENGLSAIDNLAPEQQFNVCKFYIAAVQP